jgi:endonuclease/exonuclease/phosphatase family metal-dependent hydrolase
MRIATFNLENLDLPPRAPIPLEERLPILRPQLMRLKADILCFQEVNGQRERSGAPRRLLALKQLLEGTPYADFHMVSTVSENSEGVSDVHNLVVLSRHEIASYRQIRHDFVGAPRYRCATADPPEKDAEAVAWDRPVLEAVVTLPGGRPLHLFNVHLRAPSAAPVEGQKKSPYVWKSVQGWAEGYFLATVKRAGQALELRLAVDQALDADPAALIAVCGDLNAEDHEAPLRIVEAGEDDTGSGKLAARALVPLERSVPADRRFSVMHYGRPQMLDHILVSHSLLGHFRELEIHNEALQDELIGYAKVEKAPESYHAPVVARFTFD